MSSDEKRERDVRILRRTTLLLGRAAVRCDDFAARTHAEASREYAEEATFTRELVREVRAMVARLEEK